jgi:hypothetical protein
MSIAEEKPAVDAILLKVLQVVPFQLTTDGGPKGGGSGSAACLASIDGRRYAELLSAAGVLD